MAAASHNLRERERELCREFTQSGPQLLRMLERAEFVPSHLRRCKGPPGAAPWLIQTKPAEHLRQAFELAPEVLVLLIPGHEAQARDIEKAEQALAEDLRLDTGVVLVFANDRLAADRLALVARRTGRQYVFLELEQALDVPDPRAWLRAKMREQFGLANLFEPGPPVIGWDFFGRAREQKRLQGYLGAGKPVGLYGLRKIGKTSLALRTLAQLVRDREVLGLHLDMQKLGAPRERNLAGFMRSLIRALGEAMSKAGVSSEALGFDADFASAKRLRTLATADAEQLGFDAVDATVDWTSNAPGRSVVVFIDEYERLFDTSLFPIEHAQSIFDYLRGMVQTHPGQFNFLLAGLSRECAMQPRLGDRQNPLFNFLADFPLAGLERGELGELLRKIGRRLSLDFDHDACDWIWEQTGGHPALAREYGRIIDSHVSVDERRNGVQITRRRLLDAYGDFFVQIDNTMQEIFAATRSVDVRAPESLATLAALPGGPLHLPEQSAEQLRRLGVIARDGSGWAVAIGCFARYLTENVASPIAAEA